MSMLKRFVFAGLIALAAVLLVWLVVSRSARAAEPLSDYYAELVSPTGTVLLDMKEVDSRRVTITWQLRKKSDNSPAPPWVMVRFEVDGWNKQNQALICFDEELAWTDANGRVSKTFIQNCSWETARAYVFESNAKIGESGDIELCDYRDLTIDFEAQEIDVERDFGDCPCDENVEHMVAGWFLWEGDLEGGYSPARFVITGGGACVGPGWRALNPGYDGILRQIVGDPGNPNNHVYLLQLTCTAQGEPGAQLRYQARAYVLRWYVAPNTAVVFQKVSGIGPLTITVHFP